MTSTAISTTPSIWTSPATLCRRRSWRLRRCPSLPSSTTVKCRWARPCRCSMPPQETAGICWAGERSTQPLSAIWNSEALSQNLYKNNYKEITKSYCKSPSKELQYGYRKGKTLLDHEIFFFLFFWNIGCPPSSSGCSPSQLSADTAQAIFRFVCKRVRLVSDGLFCVRKSGKIGP